jgi:hypothetical protein
VSNRGGGLYVSGGATTVDHSTFTGNTASDRGGGVSNAAILKVDNSVFTTNTGTSQAGAIYTTTAGTASWVHTSCIAGNIAPSYSGVASSVSGFNAANNWWGAANGPSGSGPGSGDGVNNNVTFNPFVARLSVGVRRAGRRRSDRPHHAPGRDGDPLAPVTVPFSTAFVDEVGWHSSGRGSSTR